MANVSNTINLKRPNAEIGDRREYETSFEVPDYDLYGRHHEVSGAQATVGVTRLSDGLYLDLIVRVKVATTCDRTLEPLDLDLELVESEFLAGPDDPNLSIEDWTLDLARYTREALPSETPMKACAPGTEPVAPESGEDEIDPRWRGLDDLFASGF
ncbi:MAG: hypothetical protein WA990_06815 [Rubrobacteraceae bacterium]